MTRPIRVPRSHHRRWLGSGIVAGVLVVASSGEGRADTRAVALEAENKAIAARADALALLREGELLAERGQLKEAMEVLSSACRTLKGYPLAQADYARAQQAYGWAAVSHARELLQEGRMTEAESVLKTVVAADMDPKHEGANALLKEMADPDRFPPALTARHVANTREVQRLLRVGASQHELGDFDGAVKTFTQVLRIDAYNTAARRGMEAAEQERARYFGAARDHQRSRMLSQVNGLWEDTVPPTSEQLSSYASARDDSLRSVTSNREKIARKLQTLIVPKVDFSGAGLDEVVEFLRVRSRDLDPEGRGVDFIINLPAESASRPIDLNLSNVPLEELVRYAAEKAGAAFKIDEFAVKFVSLTDTSTEMLLRTYRVPPGFIESAPAAAAAPASPFDTNAAAAGAGTVMRRMSAKEFLEARGVSFPEGSAASYVAASNRLVVRNTVKNLEIVDMLVEQSAASSPKQALISVKMIEINQTNLEEMGFDWLLGSFNVPGSNGVFASGGPTANMPTASGNEPMFPMTLPGTDIPVGQNPMTAGLRSSGEIFSLPQIDDLLGENLNGVGANSRSPGQFALSGVLTDPQFQVVVRALSQRKGVDFVAVPSVVTKSGQKATVDLAREFIYPTEFDPPEIPQQVGFAPGIGGGQIATGNPTAPITPATPTTFEMRKVGTLIEMEPVISDNGREVELLLTPESTDFEGFIDYGSDINNTLDTGSGLVGQPVDNRIIQPIFRTNKISTAVKIYDGATVVLGGVIQDRRTEVRDKVPVIGDIPLVGRFWKSRVDRVDKKNFLVFVTVKVLDPSGQPLNQPEVSAR